MHPINTFPQWPSDKCCICGSINCFESVDHLKLEVQELHNLIDQTKRNRRFVDELKLNIG